MIDRPLKLLTSAMLHGRAEMISQLIFSASTSQGLLLFLSNNISIKNIISRLIYNLNSH